MDGLLPSYESAIEKNPWMHIARYLPSKTLCSAALVCRKWHETMTPQLWGNPASHFGTQNDTVYVALTRFKRVLPYVRPTVRQLTHTLHFPPAHAEIYGGPHAEWLRDCLEHLPRLQCLIVNGLPFFDHASLMSLRHPSLRWISCHPNVSSTFDLRLLDASGCKNATSTSLAEALRHFPNLVSLDLSHTPATKNEAVLSSFRYLSNLRVLNLRGLGLRDADILIIAPSIGTRVRSLDMSNNHLTDSSVRLLIDSCLNETVVERHSTRGPFTPVDHERLNGDMDAFESENVVKHLRSKLTQGFVGTLAIEETRDVGLTHLFLSKNALTVEGISGLLRSRRLQVLDVGTLTATTEKLYSIVSDDAAGKFDLPSVSKLTPVLSEYASAKLQYLRVNYELVTRDALMEAVPSPRAELSGDLGRYTSVHAHELEAAEPFLSECAATDTAVPELSADVPYPVELDGSSSTSPCRAARSSTTKDTKPAQSSLSWIPNIKVTTESQKVKKGPAYAPEPVLVDSPLIPISPPMHGGDHNNSPTKGSLHAPGHLSPNLPLFEDTDIPSFIPSLRTRTRHNSTNYVEDRRARLELRQSQENCLHPGMLPRIHTLVLTDVPTSTTDKTIIIRLIQYIKDAAEEASIARQRARHTYMLPPGRSRAIAEREYAHSLFALQRLVLEMAPPQETAKKVSSSWRSYPTKSSTEDADTETFWGAATHDFSFFDDEECGLPSLEPGQTLPLAAMSGLELAPERTAAPCKSNGEPVFTPLLDVVGEIAKFRKDRKLAYNNLVRLGEPEPDIENYWPGDITIVRRPANLDTGELDCYGNRYEAGWYYR